MYPAGCGALHPAGVSAVSLGGVVGPAELSARAESAPVTSSAATGTASAAVKSGRRGACFPGAGGAVLVFPGAGAGGKPGCYRADD